MAEKVVFKKAVPVWQKGMEKEKNHTLLFSESVGDNAKTLRISGSSVYSIYINGAFLATGPARCAHGFYRVDEMPLSLSKPQNKIEIYVTSANVHSFYVINQPGFLCCELLDEKGEVLKATGFDFEARVLTERVKKIQRYSFQRTFNEVYNLPKTYEEKAELSRTQDKCFIERGVYFPDYSPLYPEFIYGRGTVQFGEKLLRPFKNRCLVGVPDVIDGFEVSALSENIADEIGKMNFVLSTTEKADAKELILTENEYGIYAFEKDSTGLISFEIECESDITLYLTFDEMLEEEFVNYMRLSCLNACVWHLKKGRYKITTLEPYTFKYLSTAIQGKDAKILGMHVISLAFPTIKTELTFADEKLNKIYAAAVETFRQNTVDIYTDCPSRERAGWLCDSFFTSRVEFLLTHKTVVEKCFLENFILPDCFENLPKGMLPMCYPADFISGEFIPNWAMFYALELFEYFERSGDEDFILQAKPKMYALLDYFKKFEDEKGFLVNLESWIFVEWSDCNKYVQDLNFPTNMLYAKTKKAIGTLYQDNSLLDQSESLNKEICKMSYFDGFFHDRAVFKDEKLVVTDEVTETAQYYAFFCETATPKTHEALWRTMVQDFGPKRKENNKWEKVSFSNAFIGNYLRLELLSQYNENEKLLENIKGYFGFMAEKTGTLWEHDCDRHSLNHGFASHVLVWLYKLYQVGVIK